MGTTKLFNFTRTSVHIEDNFPREIEAFSSKNRLTAPMPWGEIVYLRRIYRDDRLKVLWEGYRKGRRCSRDTYSESYITKYASIRRVIYINKYTVIRRVIYHQVY
jgi:hypothetical protein